MVLTAPPVHAETLFLGGTGGAAEPMRIITDRFIAGTGVARAQIIPGLGSGGAIKAALEGAVHVAFSGRPLTADEERQGLTIVATACTPYVFATSHPSPGSPHPDSIAALYGEAAAKWPDGQAVKIVLRPRSESDNLILFRLFPGTEQAVREARKRDSVPVAATDQENADMAEQIEGSLIAITYMQVLTEHRPLRLLAIDGVSPGLDTYESGRYPFGKPIHMITKRDPSAGVTRFLGFLRSPEGMAVMRETGLVSCVSGSNRGV